MTYNYSNTAVATTLDGAVDAVVTEIVVDSTSGFPVSFPYSLIIDPDSASKEVVTVSAVDGTTLTVTRGEDGTTASAHDDGASVIHGAVARDFQEPQDHIDATASVHGVSGSVVGTTSTQTLTNKSMDGGANTFSNIPTSALAQPFSLLTVGTGPAMEVDGFAETVTGAAFNWQDWTPSYTDITVGDGEVVARYRQVGGHVDFKWFFGLGSTSAIGSFPQFSLPVAADTDGAFGIQLPICLGRALDSDAGDGTVAAGFLTSATDVILTVLLQVGTTFVDYDSLTTTAPWTWATDDLICVSGSYEAA